MDVALYLVGILWFSEQLRAKGIAMANKPALTIQGGEGASRLTLEVSDRSLSKTKMMLTDKEFQRYLQDLQEGELPVVIGKLELYLSLALADESETKWMLSALDDAINELVINASQRLHS